MLLFFNIFLHLYIYVYIYIYIYNRSILSATIELTVGTNEFDNSLKIELDNRKLASTFMSNLLAKLKIKVIENLIVYPYIAEFL